MSLEVFFVGGIDAKVGIAVGIGGIVDKFFATVSHSQSHTAFDLNTIFVKVLQPITPNLSRIIHRENNCR